MTTGGFALFTHAGQEEPDHQRADDKRHGGAEIHHGKTKTHRQRVGQRRADHPRQRDLRAQNRAEHHRLAAGFIGMLAGKGEHLRVGGRAKAAKEDADEQQNKVVAVPGEQHAGQHPQQAAGDNQLLAIAFTIGTPGKKLTYQNADDRAAGKKEADHCRAHVHLIGQKQAQGRGL